MAKNTSSQNQDIFENCLALAIKSHQHEHDESLCPDDEQIAAYFDGTLSSVQQEELLQRISECSHCYQKWLALAETLDYATETKPASVKHHWLKDVFDWLFIHKFAFANTMASLIVAVVLFGWFFTESDKSMLTLEEQLVQSYLDVNNIQLAHLDVSQFTRKTSTKSSFNLVPVPDKEAFSAGFKLGLKQSLNTQILQSEALVSLLDRLPDKALTCESGDKQKQSLCEEKNTLNLLLGQWAALLYQSCQSTRQLSTSYWDKQTKLLDMFITRYSDERLFPKDSSSLAKRVIALKQNFQQINNDPSLACRDINELIHYGIQR